MGHAIDHPSGRCIEPHHLGENRSCTWLAGEFDGGASWELDGHELRELGLALAARAAVIAGRHPQTREQVAVNEGELEAVRHVAEVFGVAHLHELAPQGVVPAERI